MKDSSRNPQRQHGVTLVEACAVIAIASTLALAATPNLQALIDGRRLEGTAALIATDIQYARSEAVARNQPVRLSFHATRGGSCYVIHTGAAELCGCDAPGPAVCTGEARQIKTTTLADTDRVALQANVGSVLFDPLHGTSTPTGTLRVTGPQGRAIHHVINVMGRVRSCSPLGAVPGYRAC